MTRQMADSCSPGNIPDGIDLVAYYVDGVCAAGPVKGSRHVGISSLGTNAGTVGDCEPGNPKPGFWVSWTLKRRAAGVDPTIYCADDSLSDFFAGYRWRDVRAAFLAAGVTEPHYWICKPGATSIPAGAVAVQNQLGLDGDRYDLSLVADYWPGVDPVEDVMTNEEHNALMEVLRIVNANYWQITTGYESDPSQGTPARYGQLKDFPAVVSGVAALQAAVAALPGGQAQLQPVLDAIAQLQATLGRIETALKGA